jgi:hypothetical protein
MTKNAPLIFLLAAIVAAVPSTCAPVRVQASGQSNEPRATTREHARATVIKIRRADYEGNRAELRALLDELSPGPVDRQLSSRIHYWRGFALWRRAFNGFNESAPPAELSADLESAVTEFEKALRFDPAMADANVGIVSCLQNLAFLYRGDVTKLNAVVNRFVPLLKELAATAADNPRFLWVQGASLWYAPPGVSDAQIAERRANALATYERGLHRVRSAAPPRDSLDPTWGEPELLMNLAWSHINAATPDLTAAEREVDQVLKLVPHWKYVRDTLAPMLKQTQAQRRLDFLVGRWKVRGQTYPEANGPMAGETSGTAVYRRTARDNWLLSEVMLDGPVPYGVSVLMAPTPEGSYTAVAVNNQVPSALQYAGRWLDDRVLELEMTTSVSGRRQRVTYTRISDTEVEFVVTESRDDGRTFHRHSSLTLQRM